MHTESGDSDVLWFEGAAALLHQGINQLQNGLQIIDIGGEDMSEVVVSGIKDIVSKLYVLRDSCKGASYSENPDPNTIWYHGAESILRDAIEQLQEALQLIDEQAVAATEYEEDEAEEAYSEESEETESTDQPREKKRIAIAK
ncbi:MAG: hypothetical protein JRF02_00450 [Deltaproteobacteria bacterium]|nr:hypothetical protein [Deltaproteobacteria bacterium]